MRKSSGILDFIAQTFLYGALFGAVISKGKISTNPLIWILYGIGGWVVVIIFLVLVNLVWKSFSSIRKKIHEAKVAKEPCPHGVIGGKTQIKMILGGRTQLKCAQCNQ